MENKIRFGEVRNISLLVGIVWLDKKSSRLRTDARAKLTKTVRLKVDFNVQISRPNSRIQAF